MDEVIDSEMLRKRREAKGWDQLTLAHIAQIHPSVISRLERGLQTDLKASVLIALANALEITVDTLLPISSNHRQHSSLSPELEAIVEEIGHLPASQQRHIAAILRGYLSGLPSILEHPL